MAIGKIKASRVNSVDAPTYVGEEGILFYNFANGVIRLSDGTTPGGVPVPYTIASNTTVGGIKAGPGANIGLDGLLTIDTAGLPLSIGNLAFIDTTISTLNPNVNLNLETNGTGNINLVGAVNFYKPNGIVGSTPPFFRAKSDGQLTITIPVEDPLAGGFEIIGSATGNLITPGQPGAMMHITGNPQIPARIYVDGNAEYVALVARRYNGNVATPTQVLAGQDILRINSTAATNLNGGNVGNVAMAQIRTTALENQTATAQGSSITFTVTPVGSPASARVDVANVTVANGVAATKFTTTGNVSAGNIIVTGSILGNSVTTTATIGTGNITTLNVGGNAVVTGNITAGNVAATNYTGKVTHSIRDAGNATGTTLTLDVTTDDIVKCTFTDAFTVAFDNIIPGRVVILIATNTSAGDTDIITAGISAVNMQGDSTLTVTQQTTAIITYYSLDSNVGSIYASAVYA